LIKPAKITFPNKFSLDEGKYFKGIESNESVNWVLGDVTKDTIIIMERTVTLSYGKDSTIMQKYRVSGDDTVRLESIYNNLLSDTLAMETIPSEFSFGFNSLGWINCDKFYEIENQTDLKLNYSGNMRLHCYLIFDNLSSIMNLRFTDDSNIFKYLPLGEPVTVLVTAKSDGKYWLYKQKHTLKTENQINIKPEARSLKEILDEIQALDK
ncbi:hypothetical protein, partial [Fulvivirga aurantia]|uniref:hypothetical protein n=1 Tax=Fulvivirga aurantia TaxID=2529383 RepID=UPI0016251A0A